MLDQIEPTDENIINVWCKTFSADKYKLEHAEDIELFDWMRRFISSNSVKSCKENLARLSVTRHFIVDGKSILFLTV